GAQALAIEELYVRLSARGLSCGPTFQALCAAWRRGDEIFAEARLPESLTRESSRFALHPALLDGALHALAVVTTQTPDAPVALPLPGSGVSLRAAGATRWRMRLQPLPGESAYTLSIADATGEPVATVEALTTRPSSPEQLRASLRSPQDALFRLAW